MKAMRIIIGRLIVGCVLACCLTLSTVQTYAIEHLAVSVQSTNAVLSWPSATNETYIVQFTTNLNLSYPWLTVTDFFPAASSGVVTYFTNFNSVVYPPFVAGNTNGGDINPNDTNSATSGTNTFSSTTGFYRVVRDGAYIVGLTNGTLWSGTVTLPVELGNASGSVSTLSLTENETPVGNSIQTAPAISPLALVVDTTQMSNGVHQVSASARWDDTNGNLWEADSPPVSVTVSNEISYPNWMPFFGELDNSLLIRATSAHTNTDWYIDVYDSTYSYIGTFGGHTDDGDIEVGWDLIGPYGEPHTNDNFFVFYITTDYADPVMPPIYKVTDPWTTTGGWVVAEQHAWDGAIDHDILYDELIGFAGEAQSNGGVSPPIVNGDDGNQYPFGINFQNASENSDWATFRQALYNPASRNLVYFGHGGPNGIGYNPSNTNQFIPATEIASVLHTIPPGQTNRHAFRFVFLDGCSTGQGTLPESFGIIHRNVTDLNDYTYASLRPSAFVGWSANKWITILFGTYINYDHVNFISHIQTEMLLYGNGIQTAVSNAAENYSDVTWAFTWLNQMEVFGYYDLHFSQYNN
jgi:hypothetical protein